MTEKRHHRRTKSSTVRDTTYDNSPHPHRPAFHLPPNCRLLNLRFRRCGDGEGVALLTDDRGRVVVKDVPGLRPGEHCFVLR